MGIPSFVIIMRVLFLALLLCLPALLLGAGKSEWRKKSIYQLITDRFGGASSRCNLSEYCGGTFTGLKNKLDYIQGMGFDAIWFSPTVKNQGNDYHGYGAIDFYATNEHFGTADELKALIKEIHRRGMYIMFDIVANHVAWVEDDFAKINPFNLAEHYHDACTIDFGKCCQFDAQEHLEDCRFGSGMPDLKQENEWVKQELINWIQWMISEYSVDGIRIDTVMYVPRDFWIDFTAAAGVYSIGELWCTDHDFLGSYSGTMDAFLDYPLFYKIRDAFKGGSFKNLAYEIRSLRADSRFDMGLMGTNFDNHDNQRFMYGWDVTSNMDGALLFTMFYEGVPIIYYGDEQYFNGGDDPYNREVMTGHFNTASIGYTLMKKANKIRKSINIWDLDYTDIWVEDHYFAFTRGNKVLCIFSSGNVDQEFELPNLPFSVGDKICNLLSDTVDDDCLTVYEKNGSSAVYVSLYANYSKIYGAPSTYSAELIEEQKSQL